MDVLGHNPGNGGGVIAVVAEDGNGIVVKDLLSGTLESIPKRIGDGAVYVPGPLAQAIGVDAGGYKSGGKGGGGSS